MPNLVSGDDSTEGGLRAFICCKWPRAFKKNIHPSMLCLRAVLASQALLQPTLRQVPRHPLSAPGEFTA